MANRPKPTALKKLAGNPGPRPLNDREPEFTLGVIDPPEIVKRNPTALSEWEQVTAELQAKLGATEAGRRSGRPNQE